MAQSHSTCANINAVPGISVHSDSLVYTCDVPPLAHYVVAYKRVDQL